MNLIILEIELVSNKSILVPPLILICQLPSNNLSTEDLCSIKHAGSLSKSIIKI